MPPRVEPDRVRPGMSAGTAAGRRPRRGHGRADDGVPPGTGRGPADEPAPGVRVAPRVANLPADRQRGAAGGRPRRGGQRRSTVGPGAPAVAARRPGAPAGGFGARTGVPMRESGSPSPAPARVMLMV